MDAAFHHLLDNATLSVDFIGRSNTNANTNCNRSRLVTSGYTTSLPLETGKELLKEAKGLWR